MRNAVSEREKFIWNMMGSIANAFSTLVLSIFINRILGVESGGIFSFAYANAQLMLTIGQFEVRPYQSTDIKEKYGFNTYFSLRLVSCFSMILVTLFYVILNSFSFEKGLVVFAFAAFKMVEAFADVLAGRFQQKDRIDLSGKLFFIRVTLSTIVFIVVIKFSQSLVIGAVSMFLTSFLLLVFFDSRFIFEDDKNKIAIDYRNIFSLAIEVLPLFAGAFMMMYISNAPKYAINDKFNDEFQNIYNILFMPAFVINLFSVFMFRPMLTKMAGYWNDGKLKKLARIILLMYLYILIFTGAAVFAAYIVGIPALEIMYKIDLREYKNHLMMVMVVGGISALMVFSSNVITVMRQQRYVIIAYLLTAVFSLTAVRKMVGKYAIKGAIMSYGISVLMIVVVFDFIIIIQGLRRRQGKDVG